MPREDLRIALAVLRVARGWNQDELAKASGVRNNLLSDYERGKKTPGIRNLRKLVNGMGYRISAIEEAERFLHRLATVHQLGEGEENAETVELPATEPEAPPMGEAEIHARVDQVSQQIGQAVTSATRLFFDILKSRTDNGS